MLVELALRLVDERKMSLNSSPTPSPLGLRLQLLGTVMSSEGVMVPDTLMRMLVLPTELRLQLPESESLVWRRLLMLHPFAFSASSALEDVYPIWYDPDVASATTKYFVSFASVAFAGAVNVLRLLLETDPGFISR